LHIAVSIIDKKEQYSLCVNATNYAHKPIGTKSSATTEIAQVGGHYAACKVIQFTVFGANPKLICNFL